MLKQWHDVYVESKQVEFRVELARSLVKGEFDRWNCDYFKSSVGTIALQQRQPKIHTDWEALARKLLPAKTIAKHVEEFTTSEDVAPVLAAPREWTAEAGVKN